MRLLTTFCSIALYAPAQYVPCGDQETIAATEIDDTGLSRRVTSSPHTHLHAVSIARGTTEQNQRCIQGQPATGSNYCRASDETTFGGDRNPNLELPRQSLPFEPRPSGTVRKILRGSKAFPS